MIFKHQSPKENKLLTGQAKNKKVLFTIFAVVLLGGVSFLVWQNFSNKPEPISCTQEAKLCPDGSAVGRTGPNCEFTSCPGNIVLPKGYSLDSYNVEKVLEIACVRNDDCETPLEYLIQSRCPFVSLCLDNKCAVVCPGTESKTE